MNFTFKNKKITGILTVLPDNLIRFEDEMHNYNFSEAKSLKLKMAMGFNTRRVVKPDVITSDYCVTGMEYLFEQGLLQKDDIDALIVVTQSPDYFMPPTSNVVQGKLGLKQDMFCLDISQGCAGFLIGLMQAFMLLEQDAVKKVVLINVDILSKKVSNKDRNSHPLIGDGASFTIVEKTEEQNTIYANLKMDGTGAEALLIPAGGFKQPSTAETATLKEDTAGNLRSQDHLVMKGDEVFNFVQREVPPLVESLLEWTGTEKEAVDYFFFHQPNKFMLNKLADKIGVPREKMPSNVVENFGNASGVSIPTVISYNLGEALEQNDYTVCLSGFGVGLTWSSMLMKLGKLDFNRIIYK